MELVDREVIDKQKELLVDTVRGVLGAKIEYIDMASRSHAGQKFTYIVGLTALRLAFFMGFE